MKASVKKALNAAGAALCVASLAFVFWRLRDHFHEIDLAALGAGGWALMVGAALAYGAASVLLGLAWGDLLAFCGHRASPAEAVRLHALAQIAKYVPGNIFHLAGRQALGQAAGIPGWPLARSAAWELGLIAVAGALFAVALLPLPVGVWGNALRFGLLGVVLAGFAAILLRLFGALVARAAMRQAGFLLVSGAAFFAALQALSADALGAHIAAVLGAFVIAWLAGLVMPGAPAGIGVREVVLYALLGAVQPPPTILAAVLLGRAATVVGDVLYFLIGVALGARRRDA